MLTTKKYILLLFSLAGGVCKMYSQQNSCIEELKTAYHKISANAAGADSSKITYLRYSIRTVTVDSANQPSAESVVEMWSQKKLAEVKSQQMQVYQDNNDAFVVIPSRKLVMRNDAVTVSKQKRQKQSLEMIDTLFKFCSNSNCINVKTVNEKVITLDISEKGRQFSGISKIIYTLESKQNEIKKMRLFYDPQSRSSEVVYVDYNFSRTETNYKKKKLSDHVASLFISKENKLQEIYKGYTLVDNRKQVTANMQQ